jgi:flagellar biosynthesis GTPase FlhF
MQIKRFEADDMTEALRLVKRECGDEAVILSAKEVRPGGFFSALRKKRVEITAATDYPMNHARESDRFFRTAVATATHGRAYRPCFLVVVISDR